MIEHNGDELLNDICDAIEKYCVLPGSHEYIAVTLWCAYTHFADAFDYAPRLIARSPHKRSGNTRLLEMIAELVRGPLRSINTTTPYIFRALNPVCHRIRVRRCCCRPTDFSWCCMPNSHTNCRAPGTGRGMRPARTAPLGPRSAVDGLAPGQRLSEYPACAEPTVSCTRCSRLPASPDPFR